MAETLPEVQRWYHHLLQRNVDSARVASSNLLRTLYEMGKTPGDLLAMGQDELDEFMQDYVAFFQARKLTGSTISTYLDAVKSYLAWHGRKLVRPLYVKGANESPVAEAQTIPAQRTMRALLNECDTRTSVMVCLEAYAGLRPQTLGRTDGLDGLRVGDLPELLVGKDDVTFTNVPTLIRVRKSISKTRMPYLAFLGPEGCEYLRAYLLKRLRKGEALTPDSPLVSSDDGTPRFLHRNNIQDCIRIRMRRVSMPSSTYIHRSYFDNRLVVAESRGVPAIYREFWMGHKGGLQARYALHKEHLPPDMIEDMRQAYSKALPVLEASRWKDPEVPKPKADAVEQTASLVAQELARHFVPQPSKLRQKVVEANELAEFLEQGWTFLTSLPGGKAIVEWRE